MIIVIINNFQFTIICQSTFNHWASCTLKWRSALMLLTKTSTAENDKHGTCVQQTYLLALVESLAAVLLEILASFFLGCVWSRCSGPGCSGGGASLCSASELPPLVLGLSSGLGCTSLDILTLYTHTGLYHYQCEDSSLTSSHCVQQFNLPVMS